MAERTPGDDLDPFLLQVIACPACHGDLVVRATGGADDALACVDCGLRYPIRDGIPVLLVDEAQSASPVDPA